MSSPSVKLSESELDIALEILERDGVSVFFPQVLEVNAIRHSWNRIRPVLANVELLNYEPKATLQLIAQKQRYSVRPVHLLDPIDAILLTGLVARLAPIIESTRVSKNVVFSHRFSNANAGELFLPTSGWPEFQNQIKTRKAKFYATTDIVDFYPRIYLHRLENALQAITKQQLETKAVMRFLAGKWSHGTSYGIPTGPVVSGELAEAALHEVDEFLISHNVAFSRYFDDYILFGDSEAECIRSLFLLGERLQETQGLSLNTSKTKVYSREEFVKWIEMTDRPEAQLRRSVIDKVFGGNPYVDVEYDKLTDKQRKLVDAVDARKILEEALASGQSADLQSARFILNVMTALRRPELVEIVLSNLGRLAPISDAVARFLGVLDDLKSTERKRIGSSLLNFYRHQEFISDYQLLWLLNPFARSSEWNNLEEMRRIARDGTKNRFVRRQAILALGNLADRSSLLDAKSRITETSDWEQRAILFACRNLPSDERDAFYADFKRGDWRIDSMLTKAVVVFSESLAEQ